MTNSINEIFYNTIFYSNNDNPVNRRKIQYPRIENTFVNHIEGYFTNSRNMKLYYQIFLPKKSIPIAKIIYAHGYATNNSYWGKEFALKFAKNNFLVFMIDYEGHGKSDGLWAYIENFSTIITDLQDYIKTIVNQQYVNLKTFIVGDSMGGAVAINLLRKYPDISSGCILIAPMIKISDDAKPHKMIHNFLIWLCNYIPTWPIVPNNTQPHSGFHPLLSRTTIYSNPLLYNKRPRLQTALQLYNTSCEIENNLETITFPFFIIHGKLDNLTDWEHSDILYQKSQSLDKKIKIYEEGYHCLLEGPFKRIIYNDFFNWLKLRS